MNLERSGCGTLCPQPSYNLVRRFEPVPSPLNYWPCFYGFVAILWILNSHKAFILSYVICLKDKGAHLSIRCVCCVRIMQAPKEDRIWRVLALKSSQKKWRSTLASTSWWLASQVFIGKHSACSVGASGDVGSIPGLERSPGGGHGNLLQYPCWENPMDREAWGWGSGGGYSP